MAMYGDGTAILGTTMLETAVAVILLFLTPKSITTKLAKYIPGTGGVFTRTTTIYEENARCYIAKGRAIF